MALGLTVGFNVGGAGAYVVRTVSRYRSLRRHARSNTRASLSGTKTRFLSAGWGATLFAVGGLWLLIGVKVLT